MNEFVIGFIILICYGLLIGFLVEIGNTIKNKRNGDKKE